MRKKRKKTISPIDFFNIQVAIEKAYCEYEKQNEIIFRSESNCPNFKEATYRYYIRLLDTACSLFLELDLTETENAFFLVTYLPHIERACANDDIKAIPYFSLKVEGISIRSIERSYLSKNLC